MAESKLALQWSDFKERVGDFLGYGRDPDVWSEEQTFRAERCIADGERNAYDPPHHPQEQMAHTWSFLRPVRSLQTASGAFAVDLPKDFGAMLGPVTVQTTTGWYWPIKITGEGVIRELRSRGLASANGRMQLVAVQTKEVTTVGQQRYEALFWPIPDSAYTVNYTCLINPIGMSDENPFPYGGMHFASTLLEGCLAEAELHLDGAYGVHRQQFLERIRASAQVDKQQGRAEYIGYNDDPGTPESRRVFGGKQLAYPDANVTYGGIQY